MYIFCMIVVFNISVYYNAQNSFRIFTYLVKIIVVRLLIFEFDINCKENDGRKFGGRRMAVTIARTRG